MPEAWALVAAAAHRQPMTGCEPALGCALLVEAAGPAVGGPASGSTARRSPTGRIPESAVEEIALFVAGG